MAARPVQNDASTWEAQVQKYAAEIDKQFPPGYDQSGNWVDYGAGYTSYMNKHPNADPKATYTKAVAQVLAFAALVNNGTAALGKALTGGIGAEGKIVGDLPSAIPSLNPANDTGLSGLAAIGDFFGRLTEASTWERVGLVTVGLMFLGIGVVSVAGSGQAGQQVKKAGKAGALALL